MVVHAGEYREWVKPRHGGLSDSRRITYESAAGEHVVIKGSERVTDWEPVGGTVWKAVIDNSLFGSFNPFAQEVAGDWIAYQKGAPRKHLGDVYLNGVSFFEVASRAEVTDPQRRTEVVDNWTGVTNQIRDPEQTRLVWYAEVGAQTTIWANFQGADPNRELVEINVRRSVFYPEQPHLDYITVRGFELAHAASPWAPPTADRRPPTADQPGLIGPNWAKGWVIEDNVIHDAKCSAISIGKEGSTGHNYAALRGDKPGYQYQLESVLIAGIKLHAAIDVAVRHNRIHDCSLGTWLDWQAQGTGSRATSTTTTAGTSSSRSATDPTLSNTTSSAHPRRWSCSARAVPSSTT